MLDFVIVGAGRMGANHARAVNHRPDTQVAWVVDSDPEAAAALAWQYGANWASSIDLIDEVDAAIIATPTACHLEHAALLADLPLLVEKPLAPTPAHARMLVDQHRNLLTVGHVERHNPRIPWHHLTNVWHIDCRRHSRPVDRAFDNVIFDLMIHDIDLALHVADSQPVRVSATGRYDLAAAIIEFDNGITASLQAGRLAESKQRRLTVTTVCDVVDVDLLDGHGLASQLADFVHCIDTEDDPKVTGQDGIDAVTVAWQMAVQL